MPEKEPSAARLSIGALSRATSIPVETLRTWESRYGFPVPERLPSGHRLYPLATVPRLRRIAEALARGHRARQVVGATDDDLQKLLAAPGRGPDTARPASGAVPADNVSQLLALVEAFDSERLTHALFSASARMGPLPFLERVAAPLLREVGEGWASGHLEVRHEHFVSERLGDVLRSLRLPIEERASGPLVGFATLPGEAHGLGLQMAALAVAAAGCRVLYLGTETPEGDIVSLARDLAARAVAVSVSAGGGKARAGTALRRLRAALPRRCALLVGGEGAPALLHGAYVFRDLASLDRWAASVASNSKPIQ